MTEINFNNKINNGGITREDFLAKFNDAEMKEKAGSIFDKFNTNNTGESANKLDTDEQVGLLAFLNKLAGNDTTITESEFTQSSLKQTYGFSNMDELSAFSSAYGSLTENGYDVTFQKDNKSARIESLGNRKYTFDDDAATTSVSRTEENGTVVTENSDGTVKEETADTSETRRKKQKYDPVHLNDNWRNQRDVANKIVSGEGNYGAMKNMRTAAEVFNAILAEKGITISDATEKDTLLKTFIKFNPSIFDKETGKVWYDADWSKLDFPNDVQSDGAGMKAEGADISDVGEAAEENSTVGWYNKSGDAASNVNGITVATLKRAQSKEGDETSAARYILDQVLVTKMGGVISNENKAKLLSEIIKRNQHVLTPNGYLKDGVDDNALSTLKIPTMKWIKENCRVKAGTEEGTSVQQTSGNKTIMGRNGYSATKVGENWEYRDPQGNKMEADKFKSVCPSIYKFTTTGSWT